MSIVKDVRAQEAAVPVTQDIFSIDVHYSHGLSNRIKQNSCGHLSSFNEVPGSWLQ